MKYVLIIADGIADEPVAALGGKTPLEALDLPAFDTLAGHRMGRVMTVPEGLPPGSDTAILSIFGNDPRTCYTGRSPLEAAGSGVLLAPGAVSFRVNLVSLEGEDFQDAVIRSHNGGSIEGDEAEALMASLLADPAFAAQCAAIGLRIHPTRTFRHVGELAPEAVPEPLAFTLTEPHNVLDERIAPHLPRGTMVEAITALMARSFAVLKDHPVNKARVARGQLPANAIWPWGAGKATQLPDFVQKYGKHATVISAVPLVWGIAALSNLPAPHVPGATGELDTNYEGKVQAALEALCQGDDLVFLHIEAPDECAHAGDVEGKCEAIRRIDHRVVEPLLSALPGSDVDFRILLLSDHPTLLRTRTHDGAPVPYCLYDSRKTPQSRKFSERGVRDTALLPEGEMLLPLLFSDDL